MEWFQTSFTVFIELLKAVVVSGEITPSSAVVCCGLMVCTVVLAGTGRQCPWSWSQLSQRVRISVCLCEHPRFKALCLFNSIFSMTQRDSKEKAGWGWWSSGSASVCVSASSPRAAGLGSGLLWLEAFLNSAASKLPKPSELRGQNFILCISAKV